MGKVVGLTYNLKSEYIFKEGDPKDANAEFDHPDTIKEIEKALVSFGHRVIRIGNVSRLLDMLDNISVDVVFNISEGMSGRNRESQIPIILEMMEIPFVGADGLTLGLTLDKVITKKVLSFEGIPTPRFIEIKEVNGYDLKNVGLSFPLIVKPRHEGSSKGLTDESVVKDMDSLKRQAEWVINTYCQPALVEEFIEGSEFTVAILGSDPPEVLPLVQIKIDGRLKLGELFYTFDRIRRRDAITYVCPAKVNKELEKRIIDVAVKAYSALECRDFGRVDIRVDNSGNPYVLEINPLPSLSLEDVFMVIAKYLGIGYGGVINRILDCALKRCGLY